MSKWTKRISLFVLAGVFIFAAQASGTIYYWDAEGSDGQWQTATNWTDDTVPGAYDYSWFNSGTLGAQTINLSADSYTAYIYQQGSVNGGYTISSTNGSKLVVPKTMTILNYTNYDLTFDVPIHVNSTTPDYIQVAAYNSASKVIFNGAVADGQKPSFRVKEGAGKVYLNGDRVGSDGMILQLNGTTESHVVLNAQNAIGDSGIGTGGGFMISSGSSDTQGTVGLGSDVDGKFIQISGGSGAKMTIAVESGDTDRTLTMRPEAGVDYETGSLVCYAKNYEGGTLELGDNFASGAGNVTMHVLATNNTETGIGTDWAMPDTIIKSGNTLILDGTAANTVIQMYEYYVTSGFMGCDFTGDGTIVVASNAEVYYGKKDGSNGHGYVDIGGNLAVQVDGSLDISNRNQTWASLSGTGTVALGGATLAVSSLAPGNSAGTLTISESGTVNVTGATFELDALAGTSDQLVVSTADLNLSGTITIVDLGAMEVGDYTLVAMGSGTASLGSYSLALPSGDYAGSLALSGGDVVLSITAVPEPATLALLAMGGGLLVLRRRRK